MTYLILNYALSVFFIVLGLYILTLYNKKEIYDTTLAINSTVIIPITSILFSLVATVAYNDLFGVELLSKDVASGLSRIIFLFEAIFMTNISIYFLRKKIKKANTFFILFRVIFYAFAFFIIFFKFKSIEISFTSGISIKSSQIFGGELYDFIPLSWFTIFVVVYRFLLPGFSALIIMLFSEYSSTRLEKFQSFLSGLAVLSAWLTFIVLNILSRSLIGIYLLYLMAYLFLIIILLKSEELDATPSKSDVVGFSLRALSSIIPGLFFVFVFMLFYILFANRVIFTSRGQLGRHYIQYEIMFGRPVLFSTIAILIVAAISLALFKLLSHLTKIQFLRSSNYEVAFEKSLSSIDYSVEMDEIISNMYNILKVNVQCSSVSIFVNSGTEFFESAFSSNNIKCNIKTNFDCFNELINIGQNIVCLNELESKHFLLNSKDDLLKIFQDIDADVLILLNEGINILGCIFIGKRKNGDHYTAYDLNLFSKLYTYFFVFGYYMKNISNRDIIGTVNKEIRMSSQIITSIQKDVDNVSSEKMDAGYIMRPAHNIGGEFIDLIRINNQTHLFVIGSLSGKGIAASMNMVILKSVIRTFLEETKDFKQLVEKVNLFIRENLPKGTIFNGMFALVDFRSDLMYYINCGIPAIFTYTQAYNNVIEIQGRGHVLGFVRDIAPYISVRQIKLNEGDIFLACTNGLINSRSLRGEQFGKTRAQQCILANLVFPASRIAQFEYDSVTKFLSKEIEEDISVLVMKYL